MLNVEEKNVIVYVQARKSFNKDLIMILQIFGTIAKPIQ